MSEKPIPEELDKTVMGRKLNEDKLRESEERYRALFETMAQGVVYQDAEGKIISANPSAEKILGLSLDQMQGRTSIDPRWKSIHENGSDFPGETHPSMVALKTGEEVKDVIMGVFNPQTESYRWISINAVPQFKEGESSAYQVYTTFDDITARKEVEAQLQKSERNLAEAQELAHVGSWDWDVRTGAVEWSHEVYRIFGLDPEHFQPQIDSVMSRFHPDDRNKHEELIEQSLANRESYSFDARVLQPEGTVREVVSTAQGRYDDEGRLKRIVGTVHDITERKQVEEVLKNRAEQFLALHEISLEITKPHDVSELLHKIVERATHLLEGSSGGMYLSDPEKKEVRCVVSYQTPHDFTGTVLKYGEGAAGIVAQTGEPLIIDDYTAWKNRAGVFEQHQPFKSVVSVPLIWQNEIIGVIHVVDTEKTRRFTKDDLNLLSLFANQAVIAIHNARLVNQIKAQTEELKKRNEELKLEVAERKQAEEERWESEVKMRSIFRAAPIGIGVMSNRVFLELNDRFCEITGYARNELIGENARLVYATDEDYEYVGREKYRQIEERGTGTVETRLKRKDGAIIDVLLSSTTLNPADFSAGVAFAAIDITERKRAEDALRESEERYGLATKRGNVGVWDWNLDTGEIFVSPDLKAILGYEDSEIENHIDDWGRHVYSEDVEKVMQEANACIDGEKSDYQVEHRMVHKDGKICWFLASGKVKRDETGKAVRFVGTNTDITNIKNLEEKLRHALKMESIGTLAGGIAHEFNNILGIMIGNTELALMDVPDWNPAKGCLEEIRKASLRAKDVVRQIMSFARKTPFERKPLQMRTVIKESLKLMRSTIPTIVEIRQTIACESEMILAEPTEISQVLINLCTNSAHAMGEGAGVLEIDLKVVTLDDDSASHYEDLKSGDFVKLTVRDTGYGIQPEIMDRIFDPYFTTKEVHEGLGMGLAVVYGIVKKHDGAIKVSSEIGKGTVVEVLFPLVKETVELEFKEESADLPDGTECILFVDDEESLAKAVEQMLARIGYEVVTETNPMEALALFKAEPDRFDLVITDMAMPQLTGDNLAQEMMKIRKDIPVILCTGHSAHIDQDRAKELGLATYVMKPLVMRDFANTVRNVLDAAKK